MPTHHAIAPALLQFTAALILFCLSAAAPAAPAGQQHDVINVTSLDAPAGAVVLLPGRWFAAAPSTTAPALAHGAVLPAPAPALAPALVLMHGCGGPYDARGRLAERYTALAARLNTLGVHVLVLDSFTPRGQKQICTQLTGQRSITQQQRRRDALGALQWLAGPAGRERGGDATRLGLLGWSNGGSTVLAAINQRHPEVAAALVRPSVAVAFYPGCEVESARGFEPVAPLLMLLGELDDWTPPGPCKVLAAAVPATGPAVQWESYAGAYHGFDGNAPLRLRRDVPNGVNPGQGVHVGSEPAARAASALRLDRFLQETWNLRP
ncbi:MAG: dienelactone hydrolase family protein [Rubrivivax sp.]|nr:dienelactone hydrolase family protein [Rubrivivax sp.]